MCAQMGRKKYQGVSYDVPVYRVALVKEAEVKYEREHLSSPVDTASFLARYFEGHDRESFVVVMLDGKNRLIGVNTVSVGSLNQSIVHPREVFKPAILCNAATVILAHNHPSGDPCPSPADRDVQNSLESAGQLLGIAVSDHIIIGDAGSYFSFLEEKEQGRRERSGQYKSRRLSAAQQRLARGRATGEDIVFVATQKTLGIFDLEPGKRPDELRSVIDLLTPIRERKRGPTKVRREAIAQIELAKLLLENYSSDKAA